MKTLITFILLFYIAFDTKAQDNKTNVADTINTIDLNGKKQGHWIVYGKNKPGTCFKTNQKIEEGYYKNNRKSGIWKEYYCNGFLKNTLTFVDGRPNGLQKTFYDNGQIEAVGTWTNNRWEGVYKKYTKEGREIKDSTKFYIYNDTIVHPKK